MLINKFICEILFIIYRQAQGKAKDPTMNSYKSKIISLFGEDHLESDEEFLEAERQLKQRLRRAFGSDSEEDNPERCYGVIL